MDKIPFGVYDFLAYLSSGTALVLTTDYVAGSTLLLRKEGVSTSVGVLLIFAAYILGQIVSNVSSWLYEGNLVHRLLESPTKNLLRNKNQQPKWRFLFPGYYRPLPTDTQRRLLETAQRNGCTSTGEALFLHCYGNATRMLPALQVRLDEFRNQYGFARNVSCSLLIASATITIGSYRHPERINLQWALAALICSIGLLYRYLKFFRQYTYELLIRYSEVNFNG